MACETICTFFYVFQNPKNMTFYVFLSCCTRFPQQWLKLWGTGIRGLKRGMATLSQCNQELLVVRVGRHPGELGASKSMECDIFPFSALTLLVRRQEGHPACKKNWRLVLLVVMIWLELCTTSGSSSPVVTTTSIILCFNKHRLTQVHLENGH